MRKRRLLVVFLAVATLGGSARGEEPQPASLPDLVGPRALAMSAYRGVVAGNDGIWTNAASLAAQRRYAVETYWFMDRAGDTTSLQALSGSVVDSQSSAVTGGFAYSRLFSGQLEGNLFHLALAFPLAQSFFLGGTLKYQSVDDAAGGGMRAVNADASAFWRVSSLVGLGVAGYNLVRTGHVLLQPRALGVGLAVGDGRRFNLAFAWRADFDRQPETTNLFAVGGEYLIGDAVPLRAGFTRDETRNASFVSGGLGIVTSSGVAVDLAYRQSLERSGDRTFGVAVKVFLLSQM